MVCVGFVFLLLCVTYKVVAPAGRRHPRSERLRSFDNFGSKVFGQSSRTRPFYLQEIDKHAVEGAFTDFDVNRAALWQGKNKMFDVGRNDNNITGLHFNCLCFDPVPAFATQSVNNFKKIVLMGGNIQILRHIVELYIAILRNMVLLVEQVAPVG